MRTCGSRIISCDFDVGPHTRWVMSEPWSPHPNRGDTTDRRTEVNHRPSATGLVSAGPRLTRLPLGRSRIRPRGLGSWTGRSRAVCVRSRRVRGIGPACSWATDGMPCQSSATCAGSSAGCLQRPHREGPGSEAVRGHTSRSARTEVKSRLQAGSPSLDTRGGPPRACRRAPAARRRSGSSVACRCPPLAYSDAAVA